MPKRTAAELAAMAAGSGVETPAGEKPEGDVTYGIQPPLASAADLVQPFGKDNYGRDVFGDQPEPPEEVTGADGEEPPESPPVATDGVLEPFPAKMVALAAAAALCGVGMAYDHQSGHQAQLVDATGLVRLIEYHSDGDDVIRFVRIPEQLPLLVCSAPEG